MGHNINTLIPDTLSKLTISWISCIRWQYANKPHPHHACIYAQWHRQLEYPTVPMHSLQFLAVRTDLLWWQINTRHTQSRVRPASVIISSTYSRLSSSCSIIIHHRLPHYRGTPNSIITNTNWNNTCFYSVINSTMPASNGNGNGNTSMTSTSSRPGSSKPSTPARGANGSNTGHSSLILRKQLLGESTYRARILFDPMEWEGRELRFGSWRDCMSTCWYVELQKNPVDGFSAGLVDDDNILEWQIVIMGYVKSSSMWEGKEKKLIIFLLSSPIRSCHMNSIPRLQHMLTIQQTCGYIIWRSYPESSPDFPRSESSATSKRSSWCAGVPPATAKDDFR
jgi:hypothetical protein